MWQDPRYGNTMTDTDIQALKRAALDHLWMPSRDWVKTEAEGGPQIAVKAEGIRFTDSDGKTWIDIRGGYSSVNVGYGRTDIVEAAHEQMLRLHYYPQTSTTEVLVHLLEKLAEISPGSLDRTWPTTGGSEANETAIKIAKSYHKRTGEAGRYRIIGRRGSYHGATQGVMWLGGSSSVADFQPPYPGIVHAPHPLAYRCELGGTTPSECAILCAQAIEDLIVFHGAKTVAAVIAEPVSTSVGCAVPGDEYWPMLRQICDRHGVILIADEVVTGFGRTGKMFGLEHWDVAPDIMTMSKGISSSYLPIGGAIVSREIADRFGSDDNHFRQALTFGGHPVAAAAALKNIEIIESEGLIQNAAETGAYFKEKLEDLMDRHQMIGDVRGIGMLVAIEIVKDRYTREYFPKDLGLGNKLTEKFRRESLLLETDGQIIGFNPPLCTTRSDVDEIVGVVDMAMTEVESELSMSG